MAAKKDVLEKLTALGKRTRESDVLVIYFSGYGASVANADGQAVPVLVPYDALPEKIGETYGRGLGLEQVYESKDVEWRQISNPDGVSTFEIFRRFMPTRGGFRGSRSMMMPHMLGMPENRADRGETKSEQIIYVGLDMGPIESARRADTRHTVIMAAILLLYTL